MNLEEPAFETCSAEFKMRGKTGTEQVFNTSVRKDVTPAEFRILQAIHGKDAVEVMEVTGPALEDDGYEEDGTTKRFRPRTEQEELDRLIAWYGQKEVRRVYREENPELHMTFASARIPVKIPDNVRRIKKQDAAKTSKDNLGAALSQGSGNEKTGESGRNPPG